MQAAILAGGGRDARLRGLSPISRRGDCNRLVSLSSSACSSLPLLRSDSAPIVLRLSLFGAVPRTASIERLALACHSIVRRSSSRISSRLVSPSCLQRNSTRAARSVSTARSSLQMAACVHCPASSLQKQRIDREEQTMQQVGVIKLSQGLHPPTGISNYNSRTHTGWAN